MLLTLWMINSKTLTADVFSAGETDKTLLEQQLKKKGATDMYDGKAETLSIQLVVVVIVLITAVIGFMVFLRFKRSKEQFPAKPSDKREEMA